MNTEIFTKRAYEAASPGDGYRIYIDRLWPQGLSHLTFHYDLWDKDVAPSTALRQWFHKNPAAEWQEFEKKYEAELLQNPDFEELKTLIAQKPIVTLLYSSHDTEHNNAIVLKNLLTTQHI